MKLLPLLTLALSIAIIYPIASHAEDAKPAGPAHGNPEDRFKAMAEKLGLTEDQQTKIKTILETKGPQLRELMKKGRENLTEEEKTKIRELIRSQREEITALLTPEQKEKARAEQAERVERAEADEQATKPDAAK